MNNALKSFVHELYDFLHTVTIYNPYIMRFHEERIKLETGEDVIYPENNPYIMNMLGEYYEHPSPDFARLNDEPITIISHDRTDETLVLCRSVLEGDGADPGHPITLQNYRNTPRLLQALFAKYPERTDFIKACFFPVEQSAILADDGFEYSIKAADFSLLAHGAEYTLPSYERASLVHALKTFLVKHEKRWHVPEYLDHEKYAADVYWSKLWALLPQVLLRQRVNNMNTSLAHRDLIWMYLSSHGLGDYRDVLSREQEMFLYKNIRYLKKIRGSRQSVKLLVENLLKPSGLGLAEKQLVLNEDTMIADGLPMPLVITKQIDDTDEQFSVDSFDYPETFGDVYDREVEDDLEPGYGPQQQSDQEYRFRHAISTRLPTKLLELKTGRYGLRVASAYFRFVTESLLYWLSLKDSSGNFIVDFNVSVPVGDSNLQHVISVREALALFYYCTLQQIAPHITITEENRDAYVGKTVLVQGQPVTLTAATVDAYAADSSLILAGPITFPEKVILTRPFKSGLPTLDKTFTHLGHEYNLNEFFDFSLPRNTPVTQNLNSAKKIAQFADDQFTVRVNDIAFVESENAVLFKTACHFLYGQTVVDETITLDWGTLSEHDTIEDWIATDELLQDYIEKLNVSENRSLEYEDLATNIIQAIIDPNTSVYLSTIPNSTTRYELLRELLMQLCTYDVAFLNTDSELFEPTVGFETYVDNEAESLFDDTNILYQYLRAASGGVIGSLMEDWPAAGEPHPLKWREDDNLRADLVMMDDGDDRAEMVIISSGVLYGKEDGDFVYDQFGFTETNPNITGSDVSVNSVRIHAHPSIRHVEATVETVTVPDLYAPYPNEPDDEIVIDTDYEYDAPLRASIQVSQAEEATFETTVSAGTIVDVITAEASSEVTAKKLSIVEDIKPDDFAITITKLSS